MLGHLSFGVSDLERAIVFYDAVLAPLGLTRVWTNTDAAGYGPPGRGDLLALKKRSAASPPGPGFIWPSMRHRVTPLMPSTQQLWALAGVIMVLPVCVRTMDQPTMRRL